VVASGLKLQASSSRLQKRRSWPASTSSELVQVMDWLDWLASKLGKNCALEGLFHPPVLMLMLVFTLALTNPGNQSLTKPHPHGNPTATTTRTTATMARTTQAARRRRRRRLNWDAGVSPRQADLLTTHALPHALTHALARSLLTDLWIRCICIHSRSSSSTCSLLQY
jgi:hypothetical protein